MIVLASKFIYLTFCGNAGLQSRSLGHIHLRKLHPVGSLYVFLMEINGILYLIFKDFPVPVYSVSIAVHCLRGNGLGASVLIGKLDLKHLGGGNQPYKYRRYTCLKVFGKDRKICCLRRLLY